MSYASGGGGYGGSLWDGEGSDLPEDGIVPHACRTCGAECDCARDYAPNCHHCHDEEDLPPCRECFQRPPKLETRTMTYAEVHEWLREHDNHVGVVVMIRAVGGEYGEPAVMRRFECSTCDVVLSAITPGQS